MLRAVRLAHCSGQFLVETLKQDDLVKENSECGLLVDKAIHQLLVFLSTKHPTLKPEEGRRAHYQTATVFVSE